MLSESTQWEAQNRVHAVLSSIITMKAMEEDKKWNWVDSRHVCVHANKSNILF